MKIRVDEVKREIDMEALLLYGKFQYEIVYKNIGEEIK